MKPILALGFGLVLAAGGAFAQDVESAVKARNAHMSLYGFNLGILGAMAKGEAEYNAEIAQAAATSISALTKMPQSSFWPQGSDNSVIESSRALPALWTGFEDAIAISRDLAAAATALEAVAGDGLDAMRGAMGPVGQACGACHKAYRAPKS